jgi:CubicO group peptidase (beta-lactamase class C family)
MTTDDADLTERLRTLLGPRHPVAGAAVVTPAGTRTAMLGAAEDADFEIGSISKGVTGLLYAQALERGEVTPETTLGELLPLGSAPAAAVTLATLSTHRSGLPRLPASAQPWRRTVALWRRGTNPYGESLAELLEQARTAPVGRPKPAYSNFGFELLGHALAAAASTTYRDLVRERIADPLGLATFYAPRDATELRPTALPGRSRSGKPREPWTGEAIAPAGGLRATVGDMATLTAALLDGSAPGAAALDPVADFSRAVRIGAAWITMAVDGRPVTWHNGGTGGFRSWLGLDRAAGTGVVVLSATGASVDRAGFRLLEHARG